MCTAYTFVYDCEYAVTLDVFGGEGIYNVANTQKDA